jgi:hypothetical protein
LWRLDRYFGPAAADIPMQKFLPIHLFGGETGKCVAYLENYFFGGTRHSPKKSPSGCTLATARARLRKSSQFRAQPLEPLPESVRRKA